MSVTQTLKMFSNWTDESETKAILLMGANQDNGAAFYDNFQRLTLQYLLVFWC